MYQPANSGDSICLDIGYTGLLDHDQVSEPVQHPIHFPGVTYHLPQMMHQQPPGAPPGQRHMFQQPPHQQFISNVRLPNIAPRQPLPNGLVFDEARCAEIITAVLQNKEFTLAQLVLDLRQLIIDDGAIILQLLLRHAGEKISIKLLTQTVPIARAQVACNELTEPITNKPSPVEEEQKAENYPEAINDHDSDATVKRAEYIQDGEHFSLAVCSILERADIPVIESELEFMYNESTELGEDCFTAALNKLGVNNLYELLVDISEAEWDEGLTVFGIRMNKSYKTLNGAEAVFYYSDIDGESDHDWLVDEDYYSEQTRDGTLERWIKQLVSGFNARVASSSVEKAESYLRQKWETRRVLQLCDLNSIKSLVDIESVPVATPSTAEYLISSEMISSGQIRDYNEFDDDSEKIVDHQSDDSFEKIATQPNATALTSILRDTTSSSSNQSVTTKFVRGLHFTKQSECQQLKSMVTKEMTLDFIPIIESIVTDTKKGTVSLKVNLSGDETISGDVHQWYTTKMKSGLPIDALVEKSQQNETSLYKPVVIINANHPDCFERAMLSYIDGDVLKLRLIDHDRFARAAWTDLAWLAEHLCRKPSECYSLLVDGITFPVEQESDGGIAMQITRTFFHPENLMDAKYTGTFFYSNGQLYGARLLDAISSDTLQDRLRDFGCFNETTTRYDNHFAELKMLAASSRTPAVAFTKPESLLEEKEFPVLSERRPSGSLIPSRKPLTPKKKENTEWQAVNNKKQSSSPVETEQQQPPVQPSELSCSTSMSTRTTASVRGKENIKAKLREMKMKKMMKEK